MQQMLTDVLSYTGELFDAWLNRRLSVRDRVLAVMRARFFLHFWYTHIMTLSRTFPDLYSKTRSFISPASFNIFNRLCDTLLLLVLAYSKFYPDHPFCPWLMGTEFIEHFFGLARSLLPNFTFAELLKMVKHTMLHQRLLLSGKFDAKKERTSRAGYMLDYDATPLTEDELHQACITLSTHEINQIVELAHKEAMGVCRDILHMPVPKLPLTLVPLSGPKDQGGQDDSDDDSGDDDDFEEDDHWDGDREDEDDTERCEFVDAEDEAGAAGAAALDSARYAHLCEEYETALAHYRESRDPPASSLPQPPIPTPFPVPIPVLGTLKSEILDSFDKISIEKMLDVRKRHQSGTSTRSERAVRLDPKFVAKEGANPEQEGKEPKARIKELAHRTRIAQDLHSDATKPKTTREIRWQTVAKEITRVVPEKGKSISFESASTIDTNR
jgi:hypothetical protein